jgi:selenide,water dikinase
MAAVAQVVQRLPAQRDPELLVGAEHFSDAGVYRLTDSMAIVQSLDFFSPLVDDPFIYGRIAAANALSDVYAMGARPKTALNIVGFPDTQLEMEVLDEILRGGAERIAAAGAVIIGGHCVRDNEIKYGLSVTGVVDPNRMLTNDRARPGDVLVLTKGLGTGFITTAIRGERCPDAIRDAACASMVQLNGSAAGEAVDLGALAATDVSGFGIAGHAFEMATASQATLRLELTRLPLLPGAESMAVKDNFTGGYHANRTHLQEHLRYEAGAGNHPLEPMLFDPQTSGGLLISISAERAETLLERCREAGDDRAAVIGTVEPKGDVDLIIRV